MARDGAWGVRLTDPAALRALAHPARLRMLDLLQEADGATATQCAAVVGLSASSCSWHLRLLARVGLVEDAGRGADGRERVWRSRVPSWQVDLDGIDAEPAEAQAIDVAVTEALLKASDETVRGFTVTAAQGGESAAWRRGALVSNSALRVTAEELEQLTEQVRELLRPYSRRERSDAPPDARIVHAALRFVPQPDRPGATAP